MVSISANREEITAFNKIFPKGYTNIDHNDFLNCMGLLTHLLASCCSDTQSNFIQHDEPIKMPNYFRLLRQGHILDI
jgi:hypothetical protein